MEIFVYRDLYGTSEDERRSRMVWAWMCPAHKEGGILGAICEREAIAEAEERWPDARVGVGDDRIDDR